MSSCQQSPDIPPIAHALGTVVRPLNRLFDWLYHSKYNPLYRSGTLAVGFLFVLLATGFYLIFFYSVSSPYESVERIQSQAWLGRWMRALHRYATVGALLAVVFHILQLLVQGKTWGPRLLAWLSGIILFAAMFLSAVTGYVMVWDQHAQLLAMAGAEMLQSFPSLRSPLGQAFSGGTPLPASFFFMNLFLHVAVPLGMIFGLWIHTAKLSRSVWFPTREIFYGSVLGVFVLSILWPAVLTPKADLLAIVGEIPVDWITGFWLPLWKYTSPFMSLVIIVFLFFLGLSVPLWWRPRRGKERERSQVDDDLCTGCTQCTRDCPYEAITMHPHPDGKYLLAQVDPKSCVSCGICAASCDVHAIGPPARTGKDQIEQVQQYIGQEFSGSERAEVVAITCINNGRVGAQLQEHAAQSSGVAVHVVECCGTLHSEMLESLLETSGGVFLLGCPARNCMNRDGLDLLEGRLFQRRVPFLARDIDRRRLCVGANSEQEKNEFIPNLERFQRNLKKLDQNGDGGTLESTSPKIPFFQRVRMVLTSALILIGIGWVSQAPFGSDAPHAVARFLARVPGHLKQNCRKPTPEELSALPVHMRRPEICESVPVRYQLVVEIAGKELLRKEFSKPIARDSEPIFIQEEVVVEPGLQDLRVSFEVLGATEVSSPSPALKRNVEFVAGRIYLVRYLASENDLELVM